MRIHLVCAVSLLAGAALVPAQIGLTHYSLETLLSDADLVVRGVMVEAVRGKENEQWVWYDLVFDVSETIKGEPLKQVTFSMYSFRGDEGWGQYVEAGQEQLWFMHDSKRFVQGEDKERAAIRARHPFKPLRSWSHIRLGPKVAREIPFTMAPPPFFAMDFSVLETPEEILAAARAAVAAEPRARPGHHSMTIPRLVAQRSGRSGDANGFIVPADGRLETVAHMLIDSPDEALPDFEKWQAANGGDRDRSRRWFDHEANALRAEGARALRYFRTPENTARLKALLDHPATVGMGDLEEERFFVRSAAWEVLQEWKAAGLERPVLFKGRDARPPANDAELRYWLGSMLLHHRFDSHEVAAAIDVDRSEVEKLRERFKLYRNTKPARAADAPLLVMPYPGGRHPRIGFRDGAIRPQRETKLSVFVPWDEGSYVVADVPEAIWSNLGLTYLAHTHVPTIWSEREIELEKLEWNRRPDGSFDMQRALPNGIEFGTKVVPGRDAVRMEMWLKNGTDKELTGLRVQNCIMLRQARGFASQTNDNKVFKAPYAACRNDAGTRWIITAWTPCDRPWANPPCPCLHSDPKFPDCPPGETRRIRGWLSFYEGEDLDAELKRIEVTGWRGAADE